MPEAAPPLRPFCVSLFSNSIPFRGIRAIRGQNLYFRHGGLTPAISSRSNREPANYQTDFPSVPVFLSSKIVPRF
jgi:hypothetical protein